MRWAITSTPSTRKRTSRRVLLRLEVDVARPVLGGLEDDRVDEPDDRPLRDPVVGREVVGLVLDRLVGVVVEDGGEGDVRPAQAPDLDHDVLERRDGELDREPRGQAQLVDPVDVVGIGERDPQRVLVDRVGDRADPLEHGERDELGRLGRDAGHGQVDERQAVALGELPGPVEVVELVVLDVGRRAGGTRRAAAVTSPCSSSTARPRRRPGRPRGRGRRRGRARAAARSDGRCSPPALRRGPGRRG